MLMYVRRLNNYQNCLLDCESGFWQIRMTPEASRLAAFITPDGLNEFGLTNASATFQRAMDIALSSMSRLCAMVYIDDVLIFSKSFEEHLDNVREVLASFERVNLKLSKCTFIATELKFLGHIINREGLKMDPEKIKVVEDWVAPTCVKEMQQFLGFVNYYRDFIQGFSSIAQPLYQVAAAKIGKQKKFSDIFTEELIVKFEQLKKAVATVDGGPTLAYPNFDKPFRLTTDAHPNACVGAILSQLDVNGQDRPIAFASSGVDAQMRERYEIAMLTSLGATEAECNVFSYGFWHDTFSTIFILKEMSFFSLITKH